MDVKDLMVGDLVKDRGGKLLRIDWFEKDKVCMDIYNDSPYPIHPLTEYFEYLQPIPITEEILVKCGFEKLRESEYTINTYELHGIQVWVNNGQFLLLSKYPIDYLHELQQLYKILTKKELEVKL